MLNWIITSSILIITVITLRFCLKGKISLRLQYSLWVLVLIRLLIPFSFGETMISIGNWLDSAKDTKEVQQVIELTQTPLPSMTYNDAYDIVEEQYAQEGIAIDNISMEEFSETIEYEILDTMHGGYTPAEIWKMIWLVGMVLLGLYFVTTNLHFWYKLKKNRVFLGTAGELMTTHSLESNLRKRGNLLPVYQTNIVETPCLYGVMSTSIYVTDEVVGERECLRHVLEHESTHYHHMDYIWSVLRVACVILHWYNPLVWGAALLSQRDAELACDEATIERLGESERAAYGRTLIGLTCEKRTAVLITATTMTGSKKSIKERIDLIVKKPKMAVVTVVALVVLLGIVIGWTFTGAKAEYVRFSEWTEQLEVKDINYLHVAKNYGAFDKLHYYLSEEESKQLCELLQSIPEEDCYRRSQSVSEYESYRLYFQYAGHDILLKCLEDGTILFTGDSEMSNFAPKGKSLIIDYPKLWNYIVDMVDEKGHPETESHNADGTVLIEQVIHETTADLNHDGIDDLIKVMTKAKEGRAWVDLDYNGAFVQVHLADGDGTYRQNSVYKSEVVSSSHGGNGTFALIEKDGEDYLIYSLMYEMQGSAHYTYAIMCLEENEMITVQKDKVNFYCDPYQRAFWKKGPRREDVLPRFKAGMEPWIENGTILVSYDISTPSIVPPYANPVPASAYYDIVWARTEAEEIKEFESGIGTEDWQQELYWASLDYTKDRAWIVEQLESDYSQWFVEYDGSKLQRIDNCDYSPTSSRFGCDVPASCDVIYYRADTGEDTQDVVYKMIEKMIQARMEQTNRAYIITDYAIPEQDIIQISEDMWMITFIKGYYAFDGSDLGTMQEHINDGVNVTEDGLIPFVAQGSDDVFIHILIEKDGVYRLQRLQEMRSR